MYARDPRADWQPAMAHYFHIQPWDMRRLTPWEHDVLVAQTKIELDAIAKAAAEQQ